MVHVRPARETDVPAIRRIVADAFAPFVAGTGVRPAPLETDWPTVVSALGASVAVAGDEVAGVIVQWPHPDHVLIETVAVAPDLQGRGIAGALVDTAELLAIGSGVDVVRLYTNALMTESIRYWSHRGFTETARRAEHGFDRVFLEKRLA